MLRISFPDNNLPERRYILETLFSGFLGLPYILDPGGDPAGYRITFDDSELFIRDHFFNAYPLPLSYLTAGALPGSVAFLRNEFTPEEEIPVLYGTPELIRKDNRLVSGIDLFASAFFMLTRWEEAVDPARDLHDRFPGCHSVAFRNGFLHRPVVNEYAEMLWKMLKSLGYRGERSPRHFRLFLTHDIDHLDYPITGRILLADLLKRKSSSLAVRHLRHFLNSWGNPYDYFNFLMTRSEELGIQSRFYFMATNSGLPNDRRFYLDRKRFRTKVEEIRKRGHLIGFHPGYYTFNDPLRWRAEKELLEKALGEQVLEGRQHYLRFEVPGTFRIWDQNGMTTDSTLGYADNEGFRCGTGDTFPVFDFLERVSLRVKERPLILMDGTIKQFKHYSPGKMVECFRDYLSTGKKYQMGITVLFHNSFYGEWEEYDHVYAQMLDHCC